jgi:type I restriction enzyme S subunit
MPVPPIDEQQAIVDILRTLGNRISVNEAINHHLEQMAQAIYAQAFPCSDSPITPLGEIIDVRDGTHDSPKAVEHGFPLVTSKHLLPYGVDLVAPNRISKADFEKINERSKVDRHDILISMIGTIGLISLVIEPDINFAIKNVGLFKTSQAENLVYFLLCFLRSPEITSHIDMRLAGSTQKYISLGELRQLPVVVPSVDELQDFNDSVRPLFEEITLRTEETKRLADLRDTLLPRLMSGELSVANLGDAK